MITSPTTVRSNEIIFTARHVLRAMRPLQWPMKQVFVLSCFPFVLHTQGISETIKLGIVFAIFCAIASAAYLVNDVQDRHADRSHPEKKYRPIAAGYVSVPLALSVAGILTVAALTASVVYGSLALTAVVFTYILVSQIYNAGLKHTPIVDVFLVGSLFAVRAAAGFVMTKTYVGGWYAWVALVGMLGCSIVLVKRRNEIHALGGTGTTRKTLLFYAYPGRLDRQYMAISAVTSLMFVPASYFINPFLTGCSILVGFSLYRLWKLVEQATHDLGPMRLVLSDWPIRISIAVFVLAFSTAVLQ